MIRSSFLGLAALCLLANLAHAAGIALHGVGAVNRSMGGASTAAPIDAAGALHWNPGSISGLATNEVMFGMELLMPTEDISSTTAAGSGTTRGEPGASPIPTVAWVQKLPNTPFTIGLGMYGVAGFKLNYPGDQSNPILAFGTGFGRMFSEAEFLQMAPTVSMSLNERLSVGFAPTLTIGRLAIDPLPLTGPPIGSGRGTRNHFGGGAQAGVYYVNGCGMHWGLSVKSPQWFERFRFHSEAPPATPRVTALKLDYPMIVSLGTAYTGMSGTVFAFDVRYYDYANTDGFGDVFNWDSVFTFSAGVQRQLSDKNIVRLGYVFQQNPISDGVVASANVFSPLIIEHILTVGMSRNITEAMSVSFSYVHGFENTSTGPFPIAGTAGTVSSDISFDSAAFNVTLRY